MGCTGPYLAVVCYGVLLCVVLGSGGSGGSGGPGGQDDQTR